MNPLTNMRNVTKLSQKELEGRGKTSWHDEYKDSAWIFVGGLPFTLSEGDILAVFSQYGEIVNLNLIRDKATGKSKGFTFICYENQKSTILAVDNFNGMKLLGRSIRVDHVKDYKPPKDSDKLDDITRLLHTQGCAPDVMDALRAKAGPPEKDELIPREEDEIRDDGLGSHSVLKGFKNSFTTRIDEPLVVPKVEKVSDEEEQGYKESGVKDKEPKSHRRSKKHRSKKSKRTHSKSKKEKKRKHKRKSSSSESSSEDSSSDSESESSSSDDNSKSRKRRRHKKKSKSSR